MRTLTVRQVIEHLMEQAGSLDDEVHISLPEFTMAANGEPSRYSAPIGLVMQDRDSGHVVIEVKDDYAAEYVELTAPNVLSSTYDTDLTYTRN